MYRGFTIVGEKLQNVGFSFAQEAFKPVDISIIHNRNLKNAFPNTSTLETARITCNYCFILNIIS